MQVEVQVSPRCLDQARNEFGLRQVAAGALSIVGSILVSQRHAVDLLKLASAGGDALDLRLRELQGAAPDVAPRFLTVEAVIGDPRTPDLPSERRMAQHGRAFLQRRE